MNTGRRLSLDRLRGRSVAELRFRLWQLTAVLLERAGWLDKGELAPHTLLEGLRPEVRSRDGSLAAWVARFRARGGRGFYPALDDPSGAAAAARARDPHGVELVLDRATRARAGTLDLLGLGAVSVGQPIDWHRDPVAGIGAPRRHWSQVPYLDPAIVGDHKRVWEVNRHQWLVSLAQAWVITGDDDCARAVDDALTSWMDANPPKVGVNWASSLEVGFRAIAWCWTLRLLGSAVALRDETVQRAVGHLVLAARHLERNLSTYFSPNTHLTGEALALYHIGVELQEFTAASQWRQTGRDVLLACLPRHVRADGTYFEQSTWYHRYTLDFYTHFLILGERQGDTLPEVRDAVRRLAGVLAAIARPDGSYPLIGDDDGGRLLFLDGRPGTDARPALALAASALGDPELLARAGDAVADVAWVLGEVPLAAQSPAPLASTLYPDGGLAILRDPDDPGGTLMVVDAGPHGALNCGHAHADALAFDLTFGGLPLFVDPGTRSYSTDAAIRHRFRATASHNAATFDGRSSSEMAGPFSWATQATTRVEQWAPEAWGDWLRGTHDGYAPAASYRRDLVRFGRTFVVLDAWETAQGGSAAVHLQCAPGLALLATGRAVQVTSEGGVVAVVFVPGGQAHVEVAEVSPCYGVSVEAPHLRVETFGRGHLSLVTVIAAPGEVQDVRELHGERGRGLEISAGGTVLVVGTGIFQTTRMDLDVDAAAWWVHLDGAGAALGAWMAPGGRRLRHRAVDLITPTGGR